jgi:hypothetical protein
MADMKPIAALCTLLALSACTATPPESPDPALLKYAMGFMQGAIYPTDNPANLAINGDAFFLLSRAPEPKTWDDLVFTRDGVFNFEFKPAADKGQGTFYLQNKDGWYVLGYSSQAIENQRPFGTPPEETSGTTAAALDTVTVPDAPNGPPRAVPLRPISIDLAQNPKAANGLSFDAQGLVHVDGVEPKDPAGNRSNIYVAIAKVDKVLGLRHMVGDFRSGNRMYLYQPAAGKVYAGVAGSGNTPQQNRVVGTSNVLTPGAAEQPIPLDSIDQVFKQISSR